SDAHDALPSFPTRRSSDLSARAELFALCGCAHAPNAMALIAIEIAVSLDMCFLRIVCIGNADNTEETHVQAHGNLDCDQRHCIRSEEHTSELQSLTNIVFR